MSQSDTEGRKDARPEEQDPAYISNKFLFVLVMLGIMALVAFVKGIVDILAGR